MADLKGMFNDAFNKVSKTVRDVAESGSVREIYESGTAKAKVYGKMAKLNLELNAASEELRKVYTEIGRLYYEQNQGNPEGFFINLFANADELKAQISAKENEINSIKADISSQNSTVSEDEFIDFDDIVSQSEQNNSGN